LENQIRESLFILLRQALKARKMTYAELGTYLGLSELSVKRLFRDKDCKLSRILEVCECLEIQLEDLLAMQKRRSRTSEFLPLEMESALAENTDLFVLFILLVSEIGLDEIQTITGYQDARFYLLMRELEKIGLITLHHENRFRFLVPLPIRWRLNGPLADALKRVNANYISHCFDNDGKPNYQFITMSRMVSQTSLDELQGEAETLAQRFDYLATQDQLFFSRDELKLCKMVIGQGPFPVQDIVLDKSK
jgi:DNA-binding Xre family transcriptional regulator